jgi:PAS domain S-box-containing protein
MEMRNSPSLTDDNLLELIPEHCPDLLALLDVNGLFLYGNAAHFLRLGRGAESLLGTMVYDLIHPDDVAEFEKALTGRAARRTVFRQSARWIKEDGSSARFDSIGKWIPADKGRSYYLLLSSREVITQKSASPVLEDASEVRTDAAKLLARAEGERTHVARVIHDDLGQKLTAMSLELSLWKTELAQGKSKSVNGIREKLAVFGDLLNGMIISTRQITSTLRPRVLEEFGLTAALEWHLEKMQRQSGASCSFSAEREKLDVDAFVAAQIFRIAEEVIASRIEAGAKNLHVRLLAQDDAVALTFEDAVKQRRINTETAARIRLLGGEIEINAAEGMIVVALPTKMAGE